MDLATFCNVIEIMAGSRSVERDPDRLCCARNPPPVAALRRHGAMGLLVFRLPPGD
jgi:hypothetical protein